MSFGMNFQELSEIEQKIVVLAFGVDTLAGGDALHESGTQHFIIDTWTSGMIPPPIYFDTTATSLRQAGGAVEFSNKEAIKEYIDNYRLHHLCDEIRTQIKQLDAGRRQEVLTLVRALEIVLRTLDDNIESPGYDEKYKAVTGLTEVKIADATPFRRTLKEAVSRAVFEVGNDKDLREATLAWEKERGHIGSNNQDDSEKINGAVVQHEFNKTIQKLLEVARERLFSQLD